MILKDRVEIRRPPEHVWGFIENPEGMKTWNPKVKEVAPVTWGARGRGFRYRITYVLSGRPSELDAAIEEYQPPGKLVIRLTGGRLPRNGFVVERYELTRVKDGTRLEQTIEIHNSGIRFIFRLLIWLIHRFGKPTGKTYLVRFKELVEGTG